MKKRLFSLMLSMVIVSGSLVFPFVKSNASWYRDVAVLLYLEEIGDPYLGLSKTSESGCPKEIMEYIYNDNAEGLQLCLSQMDPFDIGELRVLATQMAGSEIYKAQYGAFNDEGNISLIEFAFSCGSVECSKFLLLRDQYEKQNTNNVVGEYPIELMIGALTSGNIELVHMASDCESRVSINSICALMSQIFDDKIETRNDICNWIIENDCFDSYEDLKCNEPKSYSSRALALLIIAESKSDYFKENGNEKFNQLQGIIKLVDELIDLNFDEEFGSMKNLIYTIAAGKKYSNCFFYKYIKKECIIKFLARSQQGYSDETKRIIIAETYNNLIKMGIEYPLYVASSIPRFTEVQGFFRKCGYEYSCDGILYVKKIKDLLMSSDLREHSELREELMSIGIDVNSSV